MDANEKSSFEQMLENHHKRNGERHRELGTNWRQRNNSNIEKKTMYKTMLENHRKRNGEIHRELSKRAKKELFGK